MNQIDKQEWERWSKTRSKGKPAYIIRWIIYWMFFMLIIRGTIMITSDKAIDINDVVAFISVTLFIGITTSLIRWMIFENRFKEME